MRMLFTEEVDAYVADNFFRKRDPRFVDADRYKERHRKEQAYRAGTKRLFSTADFVFPEGLSYCLCPAGKRLCRSGGPGTSKKWLLRSTGQPQAGACPCRQSQINQRSGKILPGCADRRYRGKETYQDQGSSKSVPAGILQILLGRPAQKGSHRTGSLHRP